MCADTNAPKPAIEPKQEDGAEKVHSSRYEWERDTASAERRQKPRQVLKRSAVIIAVMRFFRVLFGPGRSPFDKDDGPDPMAA